MQKSECCNLLLKHPRYQLFYCSAPVPATSKRLPPRADASSDRNTIFVTRQETSHDETRDKNKCDKRTQVDTQTNGPPTRNKQLMVVFHDAPIDDHLASRRLAAAELSATDLQTTDGVVCWKHAALVSTAPPGGSTQTCARASETQDDCGSRAMAPHRTINRLKSLRFDGSAALRPPTELPL